MDSDTLLRLYWQDILIGTIHEPRYFDFPWAIGRFIPTEAEAEVRALLTWFDQENKNDDPDLLSAPFPEHYLDNWTIVGADGKRVEIGPPSPDFDDMIIEWR